MFMAGSDDPKDVINNWYVLNAAQQVRVAEAWGLWDDGSGFTPIRAVDDVNLAHDSNTIVEEKFLGFTYDWYWKNSLPNDWTRVATADIAGDDVLGVNKQGADNGRYHEVYIDRVNEGSDTF